MKHLALPTAIILFICLGFFSCTKTNTNQRKLIGTWQIESYEKDSNLWSFDEQKVVHKVKHELTKKGLELNTYYLYNNDTSYIPRDLGLINYCKVEFKSDGTYEYSYDITFATPKIAVDYDNIFQQAIYKGAYEVVKDSLHIQKANSIKGSTLITRNGDTLHVYDNPSTADEPIIISGKYHIDELDDNSLFYYEDRSYESPHSTDPNIVFERQITTQFGWEKSD
ncbi:MAG: DUF5004 domain-containing protein [Bacteroidia bacterium]